MNMKIISMFLTCCMLLALFAGCAAEAPADDPVEETPVSDGREYTMPEDDSRVFYQLMVGTYSDSDGDGMGDLRGLIEKLDYINDGDPSSDTSLHAGGIWLTPVMPSPTYHKYDTTDYYDIDEDFGTLDDFRDLVAACNERGIALVIDMSINHSSNQHPWFQSACESLSVEPCGEETCTGEILCREHNPYCRYYHFTPERKSGYHEVRSAEGWFYEGEYHDGMPDLNLDSELLREEIINICSFWLDMGIYGFRLDSLKSYYGGDLQKSAEFVGWLKDTLDEKYGDVYMVGELWDNNSDHIQKYYETSGIPSLFVFDLSIQSGNSISMDVRMGRGYRLNKHIEKWDGLVPEGSVNAYFLSNHDMTRSAGTAGRDIVLEKQAAAVYLLMPGSSYIYYGEEIGMAGGSDTDPNKRMPMIWSVQSAQNMTNPPDGATSKETLSAGVAEQLEDEASLLNFYVEALKVRNSIPALVYGEPTVLDLGMDAVCSYQVTHEGRTLTVLHNCGAEAAEIPVESGTLLETLAAGGEEPSYADGIASMPPYSTVIIDVTQ